MGQQLHEGTQFPLRPSITHLDTAALTTVNVFSAWTSGGSNTLTEATTFLDDKDRHVVSSGSLILPSGLYEIDMYVYVTNATGSAKTARVAVTNGDGATVHAVSPDVAVPVTSSNGATPVRVTGAFEVTEAHASATAATDRTVALRTRAVGGASTDLDSISGACGFIRRIGNAGETGV